MQEVMEGLGSTICKMLSGDADSVRLGSHFKNN
jgi:hypothetical protein